MEKNSLSSHIRDLSPEVRAFIYSKGSLVKDYDTKLFLNDGQTVRFSSFKRTGSSSFTFDDGTMLWESQLCSRIVIMDHSRVSRIVRCKVMTGTGKTLVFDGGSLDAIWNEVQGRNYKVSANGGYRLTGRLAGFTDTQVTDEINRAYRENDIESIKGCIKSAKAYTFTEI